ncbi:MAG: DUF362 domain-containing protein [Nitrospirae bacterium]|nr:DUF362 domain-containing protein [Nitrospirota bacterium]
MIKNINRRFFLYLSLLAVAIAGWPILRKVNQWVNLPTDAQHNRPNQPTSDIYISRGGTPQQNVSKVIEMMGGIERFIGKNDIVVLKPNFQWWNQGKTNLAATKGFIDLVLGIPGFKGEVIIAENHHFMDDSRPEGEKDNIRGWTHFSEINGEIEGINHNMNTLIELYQKQGYKNVTKYHWRDGGPKRDIWGNGQNGGIVKSPAEGDGYVWTDIDYIFTGFMGLKEWKVKMTYPVFTSKYSGITIDFKNGAFKRDGKGGGSYLPDKPVKFINFPVLNTHGEDTGTTSSIKNYMGIADLSCGSWGLKPEGYVNVHACGGKYYEYAKAGPLGCFMKTIRKADLNIVTAEWVGWGSRTEITKAARTRTILASTDPIALDYYGAKNLVYPLSHNGEYHNPDNPKSSVRKFLELAQKTLGEETLDEKKMKIYQYDFKSEFTNLT